MFSNLMQEGVQDNERPEAVKAPLLPPVVWMMIFLIGGYLALRFVMED